MNSIITRFAPSPSGNLHIGSVRTALINYIISEQAKKKFPNSKFLLRVEDTDIKRSKNEFKENIINGLNWMGIKYDNEPYIQSSKIKRHQDVALELLKSHKAFKCICSSEALGKKREFNRKNKINNKKICETCENNLETQSLTNNYVIRIKIPSTGSTAINDAIQGIIKVNNKEIDDFIILRKDSTPTYMLSVVVDDYDMGVNFIIRGDDHLNNVFRQKFIYENMSWDIPKYAHLSLIHGSDGKKLSKRHGAVDINDFKKNGYLKESIINNLILLGWSPNTKDEFIDINEIIEKFNLNKISKSSSIFNYDKLNFFNNYFINKDKEYNNFNEYCESNDKLKFFVNQDKDKMKKILEIYLIKINFFKDLEDIAEPYFKEKFKIDDNKLFTDSFNDIISEFVNILENISKWDLKSLEEILKKFIDNNKIKFSLFGKPTRIILINLENGPSITDILYILGKKNSIERLKNYIHNI